MRLLRKAAPRTRSRRDSGVPPSEGGPRAGDLQVIQVPMIDVIQTALIVVAIVMLARR